MPKVGQYHSCHLNESRKLTKGNNLNFPWLLNPQRIVHISMLGEKDIYLIIHLSFINYCISKTYVRTVCSYFKSSRGVWEWATCLKLVNTCQVTKMCWLYMSHVSPVLGCQSHAKVAKVSCMSFFITLLLGNIPHTEYSVQTFSYSFNHGFKSSSNSFAWTSP